MTELRPDITIPFDLYGLDAVVTVPGTDPVSTSAIWLKPQAVTINGVLVPTRFPQRVLSLRTSAAPEILRGTAIAVALREGAAVKEWTVEAIADESDDEQWRLVVIPAEA